MGLLGISGGPSSFTQPDPRHPRMQRWRVGIERQVLAHDLVSIGYTGAWTSDLNINENLSALPSNFYYNGSARPITSAGATISCAAGVTNATAGGCLEDTNLGANVTNPFYIGNLSSLQSSNPAVYSAIASQGFFTSATIAKSSLLAAFPTSHLTVGEPIGHEREAEFDAAFTHRFSHGLTANFAYTYFDSAYANSFFQPWNPVQQKPIWQFNNIAPDRVTATWVYDLPFGKGRHWVHSTLPAALVGGWTVSGSYNWQLGSLIQMPNAFYYGNINDIKLAHPTIGEEFNTAGCVLSSAQAAPGDTIVPLGQPCTQGWDKRVGAQPGTYQARVMPYYVPGVRNPAYGIESASISRDFRFNIKEHPVTFQVRGDALDLFNHSNLGGVGTGVTSGPGVFGAITSAGGNLNRFIQIQGHIRF